MNDCLLTRVLVALYMIGIVITFGHAWAHFPDADEVRGLARGLASGIAWPFYWSGWLWSQHA